MSASNLMQDGLDPQIIQSPPQSPIPPSNLPPLQQTPIESVLDKLEALPTERQLKPDALQHDIRLGWVPRSQITGPIPLSFSHQYLDWVIQNKQQTLIYLGYRPATTFELHQTFYNEGKNYPFHQFHLCKAQFLERFFRKYYADYSFSGRQGQTVLDSELTFHSSYEGGNLDAVYFEQNQYRLILRVDSNTLGHCNYYNFIVRPSKTGRVTFRIMNINKLKSLYERGMKPYVKKLKNTNNQFIQTGEAISFASSPLNQQFQGNRTLKSLKFQFQFDEQDVDYQFCYSIPFTYTELLALLRKQKKPCMHVGKLCHSLSGVEIPLLTVTAPDRQASKQTFAIVVIGRVHPSEATGSHILNGFLRNIVGDSQEAKWLRDKAVIKIVPMLNPDGVILGNTRTGVAGKDLNRQYRKNTQFVFPEIVAIIDYILKLKEKYGQKLLFAIDVHGHSSRKNSFFFGPEFPIIDEEYSRCRLLPRLYAARTDIFRYYSCKYKVSSFKQATARGYFNSLGIRTYTHQTSAHCFFDFVTRKDKAFNRQSLQLLGKNLLQSIHDYVKHISGKNVPLPEIPQQKVNKRHIEAGKDISESESEKLSSNKDDSQDQVQDFQQKKLFQFFRKINQNRQYFYQQLVAMQGSLAPDPKQKRVKQQRKRKKSETIGIEQVKSSQVQQYRNIQSQLIVRRNSQKKVDWITKVNYPQKKKQFQQYTKLSSVIFGSSIPQHYFQPIQPSTVTSNTNKEDSFQPGFGLATKYSINYIQAQFKSNETKYPLLEPKVQKNQNKIKRDNSIKDILQVKEVPPLKVNIDNKTRQRYLKLKKELLPQTAPSQIRYSYAQMERLLSRPNQYQSVKPIPVCAVELGKIIERKKQQQQIMKMTTSLKVLTRKKSIRNIRESQPIQNRRISKSLKNGTLSKKLPSLGSLYFNK